MVQEDISKARRAPSSRRSKPRRRRAWPWLAALILLASGITLFVCLRTGGSAPRQSGPSAAAKPLSSGSYFCAGVEAQVPIYSSDGTQTGSLVRGSAVEVDGGSAIQIGGKTLYAINRSGSYLPEENLSRSAQSAVTPHTMLVKTTQNLRLTPNDLVLGPLVEKGEQVVVIGCDRLNPDGTVHLYRVRADDGVGYIPRCYLTLDTDEAALPYDQTGKGAFHLGRGDRYGGGKAGTLDFYPREKLVSETNVMPTACYSLYLDAANDTMESLEEYIALAKSSTINTFVVDIMDGSYVAYASPVMQKYSPSAYENGNFTTDIYAEFIRRLKDEGFYVVGRITAFNDYFFAVDHPECSIVDQQGKPIELSGTYWPSAFSRYAWEYKVALSVEAVELMGFDEIQYDYVRFPDGTYSYEQDGSIDYHNYFGESKAQAIQRFLMYACDVLHEMDVYVSADVFGETANPYVAAYGQYFPAISNVVDAISGMPYPDHFAQDGSYRPWEHPYDTIDDWAESVVKRQSETPTPAIVRTWIQAYDAILYPYNEYGPEEVWGEISALLDNGLTGGFITWNAGSSLSKYKELKPAFDRLS